MHPANNLNKIVTLRHMHSKMRVIVSMTEMFSKRKLARVEALYHLSTANETFNLSVALNQTFSLEIIVGATTKPSYRMKTLNTKPKS